MRQNRAVDLSIQVICLLLALMVMFPILYALSVSFMKHEHILDGTTNILPLEPTLENYRLAFTQTPILRYMWNSFVVTLISSVSRVIIAIASAYAFTYFEFKGKRIFLSLTILSN